jgi:UDP-GlcNAc:undecaprenyl-phosphate GlcNAc-1-phosphate transferase
MPYLAALISFCICLALTPLVRRAAIQKGWMAQPVKDRWHKKPTALMGGIALYFSMAVPLLFMTDFTNLLPHFMGISPEEGIQARPLPSLDAAVGIGITFLFILGFTDDRIAIKPHTKLVGQILVASLAAFLGFRLHWFTSMTLDTVVTIVWIVGITNAFNLIDNMDGLCAGIAVIAALYFGFLFQNDLAAATVAFLLAGAAGGFLIYNFNPASIFMGDCGSLVIGFILAMLGLHYAGTGAAGPVSAYAVPIMVLMVPITDTTLVTIIRLLSGRKASTGGRDHTSHRLVLMGFSERGAVTFLYGAAAVSGLGALFVSGSDDWSSPAVIIPLVISVVLMGIFIAQVRVYPDKEFSVLRNRSYTPLLMELTYKRQMAMVILDFWLIAFSYYLSYRLRFSGPDFVYYFNIFLHSLPAIIACKFTAFFVIGIYRGFWQFMSSDDVFVHLKAVTLATLLSVAVVTYIYRFENFSKGIFMIDWLLTVGLLLGTRGFFRISGDTMKRKTLSGEKVLIYGAGRGGELLLREILNNRRHSVNPVGFIDDDFLKTGKKLQGYPILGTFQDIDLLVDRHGVAGLLISFNGTAPNNLEGARDFCRKKGLFLKKFTIGLCEIKDEDSA